MNYSVNKFNYSQSKMTAGFRLHFSGPWTVSLTLPYVTYCGYLAAWVTLLSTHHHQSAKKSIEGLYVRTRLGQTDVGTEIHFSVIMWHYSNIRLSEHQLRSSPRWRCYIPCHFIVYATIFRILTASACVHEVWMLMARGSGRRRTRQAQWTCTSRSWIQAVQV